MTKRNGILLLGAFVVLPLLSSDGQAATTGFGYRGWGLRGGLTVNPDQFFAGAHVDLGEFIPNLGFMPNATIGFGDDLTLVSIRPDVSYHVPVQDIGSLYFGGILDFQWIKFDIPEILKDLGADDSDTNVGLHAMGGLKLSSTPLLLEVSIGLDESPDLKATIGYTFSAE